MYLDMGTLARIQFFPNLHRIKNEGRSVLYLLHLVLNLSHSAIWVDIFDEPLLTKGGMFRICQVTKLTAPE